MRDNLWLSEKIMLCGYIRTQVVKHKICLLTWAVSHIRHVNNTLVLTVNGEVDLQCESKK